MWALAAMDTFQPTSQYCHNLYQLSQFTLDSLSSLPAPDPLHSIYIIHSKWHPSAIVFACFELCACLRKANYSQPKWYKYSCDPDLCFPLLKSDWATRWRLWFTLSGYVLQWMQTWCLPFSLAYKNNLTSLSLSLWVLLSEPPRLSLPALPSLLTLPTYILNQVSTSFITSLHLHHFLFLFSSSSLHLSLLPFKLLICFGCLKWIAHRWPNFSVDFPKLISCCILVWIPNEYCVKIGKSLIRWNGGEKNPPPPFHPLLTESPSFTHPFFVVLFVMDGYLLFCLCKWRPNS